MAEYLNKEYDATDPDFISALDDLMLWSAPFGIELLDTINYKKNINVLDIGSGTGFPLIEISQRLGNSSKIYGIDPWKKGIHRIEKKLNALKIANVKMIEGVGEDLPFDNGFFDLIVSNNGINNVLDDKKVLAEISRTAKKGAQLVLTVNLPETMMEFYKIYEDLLDELGKEAEVEKLKEHIRFKRKPIEYTKDLIENAGFKIKSIKEDLFYFRYTDGTAMLNNNFIKAAFLDSWLNVLDEADRTSVFKEIENRINRIAGINGEVKLSIPFICVDAVKKNNPPGFQDK